MRVTDEGVTADARGRPWGPWGGTCPTPGQNNGDFIPWPLLRHCDSACGLYGTTLVLMPLDAHFARLKIGYAHRDKAKYPPYYKEGVQ